MISLPSKPNLNSARFLAEARITSSQTGQLQQRVMLTILIILSFYILGCYRSLPGPTLVILAKLINEKVDYFLVIFSFRSLGYGVGCIIGVVYDTMRSPTQRQMPIILFKAIALCTAFGIPFCYTLTNMSVLFFVSGICLSTIQIGFSIYILDFWKQASYMYFQCLHFFFNLGGLLGPILTRVFFAYNSSPMINSTRAWINENEEREDVYFPIFKYAYVVIGAIMMCFLMMWICLFLFPMYDISIRRHESLVKNPSKYFSTFAIMTTFILLFIIGIIDYGYEKILAAFAYSVYEKNTVNAAELTVIFWGFHTLGGLIITIMAKTFHPFFIISLLLVLEFCGGFSLLFAAEKNCFNLALGNAIFGLGSSCFFPTTILWLETYINITHTILAILLFAVAIAELAVPSLLDEILIYGHKGISGFVLAIPAFYLFIFGMQSIWFLKQDQKYYSRIISDSNQRRIPIFLNPNIPVVRKTSSTQTSNLLNTRSLMGVSEFARRRRLRPLGGKLFSKSRLPKSDTYVTKEFAQPRIVVDGKPDEKTENNSELNEQMNNDNTGKEIEETHSFESPDSNCDVESQTNASFKPDEKTGHPLENNGPLCKEIEETHSFELSLSKDNSESQKNPEDPKSYPRDERDENKENQIELKEPKPSGKETEEAGSSETPVSKEGEKKPEDPNSNASDKPDGK